MFWIKLKVKRTCFVFGLKMFFFHKIRKKKNAHNQKLHVEWAIQSERERKKRNRESIREEVLDVSNKNSNNVIDFELVSLSIVNNNTIIHFVCKNIVKRTKIQRTKGMSKCNKKKHEKIWRDRERERENKFSS